MAKAKLEVESDYGQVVQTFNAINKEIDETDQNLKGLGATGKESYDKMSKEAKEFTKDVSGNTKEFFKLNKQTQEQIKVIKQLTEARKKSTDPATISNYNRQIEDATRKLKKLNEETKIGKKHAKDMGDGFSSLGAQISAAFSIAAVTQFIRKIVDVRAEFQKYEAVLTNTLGSNQLAKTILTQIQSIAALTPFSVRELTESYIKLTNQGFQPTQKEIIKLGDLASSTGKSFDQLTEAIIDAQTGEFERLKEFGIRAQKEGDKVSFTFKGVKKEVDFTAKAIREYALQLGEAEGVTGSMEAISRTLGGQISNLGDNFDRFFNNLGKQSEGAFGSFLNFINEVLDFQNQQDEFMGRVIENTGDNASESSLLLQMLIDDINKYAATIEDVKDFSPQFGLLSDKLKVLNSNFAGGLIDVKEYTANLLMLGKANKGLAEQMDALKNKLNQGAPAQLGIIEKLQKEISDLTDQKNKALSESEIGRLRGEIEIKQKELDRLNGKVNSDIKRARDEFNKAVEDLRKRAKMSVLDASSGEERIQMQMKFDEEELQLLREHLIKLGQAVNKSFKLTLEQEQQFEILRLEIKKKAADETIKLEIERQNALAAQINKGNDQSLQALTNAENAALNGISATKAPNGVPEDIFETQKEKKILDVQEDFAKQRFELKKKALEDERNLELKGLDLQLQQIGNGDDKATEAKRASIMRDLALIEEKYQIEGDAIKIEIDKLLQDISDKKDELNKEKPFSLKELFGLTDDDIKNLQIALSNITDLINSSFELQLDLANQQINLSQTKIQQYNEEIQTLESKLDREYELNNEGKANNIDRINAEIAAKEEQKRKEEQIEKDALEKRKKIQKEKLNLDTLLQASNLITASTQIFASTASAGPVGVAIAIAAIATMLGAFIVTKQKSYEAINSTDNTQGFQKGGYTGDGGESQEAGVVHKGEFVTTAKKTRQHKDLLFGIHNNDERLMKAGILDLIKNTGIRLNDDLPESLNNKKQIIRQSEINAYLKTDNSALEKEVREMKELLNKMLLDNKEKNYSNQNGDLVLRKGSHKEIFKKK